MIVPSWLACLIENHRRFEMIGRRITRDACAASPWTLCLLSLVAVVAGCSQTGALRSSNTSEMKTIASVGDKPLPIVAGEPGASLRAETEDIDRPVAQGSRISGRVYDERGKPVADVEGTPRRRRGRRGKAVVTTTDRSGAFTLHGLRSGASYTVIAEYEDDEGTMSGRAQIKAPQTEVRIALQPRGGVSRGHASIRPAQPRVEPISNIDSSDEESLEENAGGSGRRINAEDLEPPAAEAAALFPDDNVRARRGAFDRSQSPAQSGWNVREGGSTPGAGSKPQRRLPDDRAEMDTGVNSSARPEPEVDDDGPNPLPPAIDSGATSSLARPRALVEENLVRTAQSEPAGLPESGASAEVAVLEKTDSSAGQLRKPAQQAPAVISAGILATDTASPRDSAKSQRRPTWRELADRQNNVPLDESLKNAASDVELPKKSGVVTLTKPRIDRRSQSYPDF